MGIPNWKIVMRIHNAHEKAWFTFDEVGPFRYSEGLNITNEVEMYELTGKIKVIFDTQTFPSGFTKREFVVTTADKYPQDIKLNLLKDKTGLLDRFDEADEVKVNFDLSGREYQEKYYVDLNAWKIEKADGSAAKGGSDGAPVAEEEPDAEGDFPF
ncbi:MAG: single-strand DNA-binding protein [Kiritimatiellia bacterium]|jgi:single-strand DNA-binding protein